MNQTIFLKFKELYFSHENKNNIINIFKSKINTIDTIDLNQLHELQELIFNNHFINIYNEYVSNNKQPNYNELMNKTNDFTVEKFIILYNTISNKSKNIQNYDKLENSCHNFDIYSKNTEYNNGEYIIKYDFKNKKSIYLKNINLYLNLYNVNEQNCSFIIEENKQKFTINIPFGYYTIKELLKCINKLLSITLKNTYNIYLHKNKNKIYFNSDKIFNLHIDKNLLGFIKKDYINNNNYISELYPDTNIYNNLYIKLYINDKEIICNTGNNNFTYFYKIITNYSKYFGIKKNFSENFNEYLFNELLDISNIKLVFFDCFHNKILKFIDFEISFEIN